MIIDSENISKNKIEEAYISFMPIGLHAYIQAYHRFDIMPSPSIFMLVESFIHGATEQFYG